VQPLLPSLAQNFTMTHDMKFKRHYIFLKVYKKLTMQGVAYKKQQDIQEYHYYKFDSKDLPTI
jgi:hypothetical protein